MKNKLLKLGLIGCCLVGSNLFAKELKMGYTNNIEKNLITDMITYCGGYVQEKSGYILTSYDKNKQNIDSLIKSRKLDVGFIKNQLTNDNVLFPTYLENNKFLFFTKGENKKGKQIKLKDLKGKSIYVIKGYYDLEKLNKRLKLGLKLTTIYKKVGMPMAVEVKNISDNKYIKNAIEYKYNTVNVDNFEKDKLKKQGYKLFELDSDKYKVKFIQAQKLLVGRNFKTNQPKIAIKSLKECIIKNKNTLIDYGKSSKWAIIF